MIILLETSGKMPHPKHPQKSVRMFFPRNRQRGILQKGAAMTCPRLEFASMVQFRGPWNAGQPACLSH